MSKWNLFVIFVQGDKVRVDAAASLCPAWDISESFGNLAKLYPRLKRHPVDTPKVSLALDRLNITHPLGRMDQLMCRTVQKFFLEKPENVKAKTLT